ncbi:MAG: 16S rRNA (cytosine(1402)-N(4))-methyltransferase RsmH, partial [Chitinophagia bacterium]|nr:16S rRNA (cytosine(1402)-N(4))-methyltransferase RsmH [Chitinophagia bacterium]
MQTATYHHITVLRSEAVDGLAIQPDGVYVDATFGGGGHSREILSRLGPNGVLLAFDQDKDAWQNKPDDARLIPVGENFRHMRSFMRLHKIEAVDGILADLGVSSYQFDTPEKGFSIRFDGPLDMRMDGRMELTAEQVIATYSEAQLHSLFEQYGEVRNSKQLAKHIVDSRKRVSVKTIAAFKAMLMPVMKGNPQKYLAQVFQALRIEVNDELGALKDLLVQSGQSLKPGGRLSVITFHSLEDRLVKQYVKRGVWDENEEARPLLKPINAKPIEPGEAEQRDNPRSVS